MEQILIEVSPEGRTKITAKGFKGHACKDATKELERALGSVTSDTPTEEMYERAPAGIQHRNRT